MTEVHIPKAWHGNLIGKQGANLKYLQATFDVKVKVPASDSPSTAVGIEGARAEDAIKEIESKLGFAVSRTELTTVSVGLTTEEANKAFPGGKLFQLMKEFGVGLRGPTDSDATLLVQGAKASVDKVIAKASEVVGRTLQAKPVAAPKPAAAAAAPTTAAAAAARPPANKSAPRSTETPAKVDFVANKIAEVLFFADGDADDVQDEKRFVQLLRSGNKTLDICVFTITSNTIADAIIAEHRTGVKVRVISDNHTADALGSDIAALAKAGIPVKVDVSEGHMHHKFCVIDGKLVLNGSFNWTRGASTCNYENVMVTNEPAFCTAFSQTFETLWNDKKRFVNFPAN